MAQAESPGNRYFWVKHKLDMAVHSLAVSPENIRGRLPRIYNILADLSVSDFPEPLQEHFEWVMGKLTKRKPRRIDRDFPDTPAQASVAAMQSKTAVQIAERIVYILDRLPDFMTDD
jgi:hypothetical protein